MPHRGISLITDFHVGEHLSSVVGVAGWSCLPGALDSIVFNAAELCRHIYWYAM